MTELKITFDFDGKNYHAVVADASHGEAVYSAYDILVGKLLNTLHPGKSLTERLMYTQRYHGEG